jgi:hypothetical protein
MDCSMLVPNTAKALAFGAGLLLVSSIIAGPKPAYAQNLIQACEALKRQTDRNKCLEEAIKALSTAPQVSAPIPVAVAELPAAPSKKEAAAKRMESVIAATTALQSVIDLGISYNDYQPYIQKLAVEIGQYKAAVQFNEEKSAVTKLEEALNAYRNAASYWQADIHFYSRDSNRIAYFGSLPMNLAGVSSIVHAYNIPTQKSDIWGLNYGATRSQALSTIWQYAKARIDDALEAVAFKPQSHVQSAQQSAGEIQPEIKKIYAVSIDPDTGAEKFLTRPSDRDALLLAERHVLQAPWLEGKGRVVNAFKNGRQYVCGSVIKNEEDLKQFVLEVRAEQVRLQRTGESFGESWQTFCFDPA